MWVRMFQKVFKYEKRLSWKVHRTGVLQLFRPRPKIAFLVSLVFRDKYTEFADKTRKFDLKIGICDQFCQRTKEDF